VASSAPQTLRPPGAWVDTANDKDGPVPGVGSRSSRASTSGSCFGDDCPSSGLYGSVGSSEARLGVNSGEPRLVRFSCGLWNDCQNDHQGKQRGCHLARFGKRTRWGPQMAVRPADQAGRGEYRFCPGPAEYAPAQTSRSPRERLRTRKWRLTAVPSCVAQVACELTPGSSAKSYRNLPTTPVRNAMALAQLY
jgi:hypothetical protein